MNIILIDNYDSYTHLISNRIETITHYKPLIVKNDQLSIHQLTLFNPDIIIISPGPGHPAQSKDVGICSDVFKTFFDTPILGICLGHQLLGHTFGAKLTQSAPITHGKSVDIHHQKNRLFENVQTPFKATRYHSLELSDPLPDDLKCLARSENNSIMAIEHHTYPWFGFQFHPESVQTIHGDQLLKNFFEIATHWLTKRRTTKKTSPTHTFHAIPINCSLSTPEFFKEKFFEEPQAIWLDQSSGQTGFSIMGCPSYSIQPDSKTRLSQSIQSKLSEIHLSPDSSPLPFKGGIIGTIDYEERFKTSPTNNTSQWWWMDRFYTYDHTHNQWYDCCLSTEPTYSPGSFPTTVSADLEPSSSSDLEVQTLWSKEDYIKHIHATKTHLQKGNTYELCLSNQFKIQSTESPLATYLRLRTLNPARYSAYIQTPSRHILSSSPECLFKLDANGQVRSEPIKGTRAKGLTPEENQIIRDDLIHSSKDQAELLMITDLIQNDLAKVVKAPSLTVSDPLRCTELATVFQLSSIIEGKLQEHKTAWDVLLALFPGGSITGAPKTRTIELIQSFEQTPRGIFTGSIGYLSVDGAADFNIAIRTIDYQNDTYTIGAGGAITIESDPEDEYQETLTKADVLIRAVRGK